MADIGLIELDTPQIVNEHLTLTHLGICSMTHEHHRPWNNKEGHIEVWLAYGYLNAEGHMIEPEYPGINIILDNTQYETLAQTVTTQKPLEQDEDLIISQYLLDNALIPPGTLITE